MEMRKHFLSHPEEKLGAVPGVYIAVDNSYREADDQQENYERQYGRKEFPVAGKKRFVNRNFYEKRLNHAEGRADYAQKQRERQNFFMFAYISV